MCSRTVTPPFRDSPNINNKPLWSSLTIAHTRGKQVRSLYTHAQNKLERICMSPLRWAEFAFISRRSRPTLVAFSGLNRITDRAGKYMRFPVFFFRVCVCVCVCECVCACTLIVTYAALHSTRSICTGNHRGFH